MSLLRHGFISLLAVFGLVGPVLADVDTSDQARVFTPGYFLDEATFDKGQYRYYHDYAVEIRQAKARGVAYTPSIAPYAPANSPIALVNASGMETVTFGVSDPGRYVESWQFYQHDTQYAVRAFTGTPKYLTVTYAQLTAGLQSSQRTFDLVPLLLMMDYTLAFDANGGTFSAAPETRTHIWSNAVEIASSAVVSRTGHAFEGWNTAADGSGRGVEAGTTCHVGQLLGLEDNHTNVTLYAKWRPLPFPLHLRPGEGIAKIFYRTNATAAWASVSTTQDVMVAFDATWSAYAVAKKGYGYGDYTPQTPLQAKMGLSGASFEPVAEPNRITVAYDGNGATSGSMGESGFSYNRSGTLKTNVLERMHRVVFGVDGPGASVDPTYAEARYAFLGWNSAADGSGLSFADRTTVTNICGSTGGRVTLYAQWASAAVELPRPERTGATFLGWYADKACTFKVGDAGDAYTPTQDITLYAKWRTGGCVLRLLFGPGISRIYYRLGNATAWTPVRGNRDVALDYRTRWQAYAVAKAGYAFTGTGSSPLQPQYGTAGEEVSVFSPEATANTIRVRYDGNGSTEGSTVVSRFAVDQAGTLSDNGFARVLTVAFNVNGAHGSVTPSYAGVTSKFAGWDTAADGSGEAFGNRATVTNLCGSTGGEVILYAQWTTGAVSLPEPTREGYVFEGWYADRACTFRVGGVGDAYRPTDDATLYARWTAGVYPLALLPGPGIDRIYYAVATSGVGGVSLPGPWFETSVSTNVCVAYGTRWYAYATAKPGYTYTETSRDRPHSAIMDAEGAEFAPEAAGGSYLVRYDGNGATHGLMSASRFYFDAPDVLAEIGYRRIYRVQFNGNGSRTSVDPAYVDAEYAFTVWNTEADGTGTAYTNQQEVVNLTTGGVFQLYAQWTNATAAVRLPLPEREGCLFGGWYAEKECTNEVGQAGDLYVPTNAVTLYAKWSTREYTLSLLPGRGIDRVYYDWEDPAAASETRRWRWVSSPTNIVLAYGIRWYAYATAAKGYTYRSTAPDRPRSGIMTIEGAEFAPEATPNVYQVVYGGNGHTSGGTSASYFTWDETDTLRANGFNRSYRVSYDVNVRDPSSWATVDPRYEDGEYAFTGWNTKSNGTGTAYADQQEVMNLATGGVFRLYAQWSDAPAAVRLPLPERDGFAFVGWSEDALSERHLRQAGTSFTPSSNTTFYALWTTNFYTVTFVDGYTGPGSSATNRPFIAARRVPYGGAALPPTPPAHAAYRFTGWSPSGYSRVQEDMTVEAQYAAIEYVVTYNSNYRDGTHEKTEWSTTCGVGKGMPTTITLLSPGDARLSMRKQGYRFVGWAWRSDAVTNDWSAGETMSYSVIAEHLKASSGGGDRADLYAVWEPIAYTVAFAPGFVLRAGDYDGSPTNQTLTYDRPARLLRNPYALDRQRFLGWSAPADAAARRVTYADQQEVANLTTEAGETVVLTAVWDGNGDRFVAFDGNGATNVTMDVQTFRGEHEQYLASNCFAKVGYTFAGWTNAVGRLYQDRAAYAFDAKAPRGTTNVLYATWQPITYTVIFNTGRDGVLGTMQPICTNNYNASFQIFNAYTNCSSTGLLGWSRQPGATEPDYELEVGEPSITVPIKELSIEENGTVPLYAVWEDVGALSKAVGLTNTALKNDSDSGSSTWYEWRVATNDFDEVGKRECIAFVDKNGVVKKFGKWWLEAVVNGPGELEYSWYYERFGDGASFELVIDENEVADKLTNTVSWSRSRKLCVEKGTHKIRWQIDGWVNDGYTVDQIYLDDISWTPTSSPEWPEYSLSYAITNGVSQPATYPFELPKLPTGYFVTNETFTFPPLVDENKKAMVVDGWEFDRWSPSNIVKGTTGDITVRAIWKGQGLSGKASVTFDGDEHVTSFPGKGERQTVDGGADVRLPSPVTVEEGHAFLGWYTNGTVRIDAGAIRVFGDVAVTARTEPIRYRIDYDCGGVAAVVNTNVLAYASATGASVGPLGDTHDWRFSGWRCTKGSATVSGLAAAIAKGTTGDVGLKADWTKRTWYTVTYALGANLARTGGGALVQSVENVSACEPPTVQADEGYVVNWGTPSTSGTQVTIAVTAVKKVVETDTQKQQEKLEPVTTKTAMLMRAAAPAYVLAAVDAAPPGAASASDGQPTGGILVANGVTNCWVSVEADAGGSVQVLDPAGGLCATNAFFAPAGVVLTAVAKAARGWRFAGWERDGGADAAIADRSASVEFTVDGPVALRALFTRLHTVTFDPGAHLVHTGSVALVQSVAEGAAVTVPGFVVDEGCTLVGWRDAEGSSVDLATWRAHGDVTFTADVTVGAHAVVFDGAAMTNRYGDAVTATAPFDTLTAGETNVTCVGWIGTGCAPASGLTTQVTFTVTGPATVTWLFRTNYWISVAARDEDGGALSQGAVAVLDPAGGVSSGNAFWAPAGAELTAVAKAAAGCRFLRWETADGGGSGAAAPTVGVSASLAFAVDGPVALTAVFDVQRYRVSFELGRHLTRTGGGALEQTVVLGESAAWPELEADTGWGCEGWYDAEGYPAEKDALGVIVADRRFVAVSTSSFYTVTFELDENLRRTGGGELEQTVAHGAAATLPSVEGVGYYTLEGWYDEDGVRVDEAAFRSIVAERSFFAKSVLDKPRIAAVVETSYERGEEIDPIEVSVNEPRAVLQVSGLPPGLAYLSAPYTALGAISGTPAASGLFTAAVTARVGGETVAATNLVFAVAAPGEGILRTAVTLWDDEAGCAVPGDAAALPGKTTGQGVYAAGRKVTLSATANKGYAFSGWYGPDLLTRAAKCVRTVADADVTVEARFVTAAADAASVQARVNGLSVVEDGIAGDDVATNVQAGVYLAWPVAVDAASATKVSVSGLPAGLRFAAKPVTAKVTVSVGGHRVTTVVTNVPAMTIYGTPTAASKVDRYGDAVPSRVKVAVTTAGRTKVTGVIALTVDALPAELVGTYAGGATNAPCGSATVTLAKTGRISGKWMSAGKTWTLAAAGFDAVTAGDPCGRVFTADVTARNGRSVESWPLAFRVDGRGLGVVAGERFDATFVPWSVEPLKSLARALKGQTFEVGPEEGVSLSGKVGASGKVTVKGSFDTGPAMPYAASATGTLEPLEDGRFGLFLYYPPKADRFDGHAVRLVLAWDGERLEAEE